MNINDCVRLHEEAFFNKIYLVSGLRRSGNHLLLQILNCSFSDNSVLFINDFPSLKNHDIDNYMEQFIQFKTNGYIKKSLIEISYNNSSFFCGHTITNKNKLINKDDIDNLYNKSKEWTNKSEDLNNKILIMSFEDQHISVMDNIAAILKNRCTNLYKIIIIRDILNCFASRFAAICNRDNKYKYNMNESRLQADINFTELVKRGGFFKTDSIIYNMWLEHSSYSKNNDYIIFNYNKFLCLSEDYKKEIFKKLDIEYNELLFKEKSTYGHSSSYNPSNGKNMIEIKNDEYFWRFSNNICSQQTIKKINIDFIIILNRILSDEIILTKLRDDFIIDITKINNISIQDKYNRFKQEPTYNIKICSEERSLKFPEFLYYKNKYLKYKHKYLEYKNKNY